MNFLPASLRNIGNGGAINRFDRELETVIENIRDVNTEPDAKRVITLKVIIKPSSDRKSASVEYQATSKIASVIGGTEHLYITEDEVVVSDVQQLTIDDQIAQINAKREDGGTK